MERILNKEKKIYRPETKSLILRKIYEPDFGILKILKIISHKSYHEPSHKFDRLIRIISDKNFLIHAMSNISNNKGATTKGIDEISSDGTSLLFIISN
jgi:hypothetical protein